MTNSNLYMPVYRNIEKEILDLSYRIHFCDNQLDVYSVHIAELLIRCAVEIESISKAIYEKEGGDMNPVDETGKARFLNYDFDCLKFLDIKWKIGKKQVILAAPSMYFSIDENKIFSPLRNSHKGEMVWQKAYQAVKHSRVENLNKANLKALLRAAAALYLLNIYYRNDEFELGTQIEAGKNFDSSLKSDLFSVKYEILSSFPYKSDTLDKIPEVTYVAIFKDDVYFSLASEFEQMQKNVIEHTIKKIGQNPSEYIKESTSNSLDIWNIAFDKSVDGGSNIPRLVGGFGKVLMEAKYIAVLNKGQNLIPETKTEVTTP